MFCVPVVVTLVDLTIIFPLTSPVNLPTGSILILLELI
jgi:hypothetical protein